MQLLLVSISEGYIQHSVLHLLNICVVLPIQVVDSVYVSRFSSGGICVDFYIVMLSCQCMTNACRCCVSESVS